MPVRHFYLLSHYIYYGLFFLFSVFWLYVNEFNSLWEDKGERSEVYCLLRRWSHPHPKHAPKPHLGYGSISFFCVLAPEGMNVIVFEERRGRGQKVVAYSDVIFTLLNLFQVSLMIRWYRKLLLYMINSSLYYCNISLFYSDDIPFE